MTLTKKTKQILIALVLVGAIVGGWAVWYVFFKPHRDVSSEKAAYTLTADELNRAIADGKIATYIDQAILVSGEVSESDAKHLVMGSVVCNFEDTNPLDVSKAAVGSRVSVQGRVSTFNDLMGEVVMDKCTLK
jgi:hypothetical protein